MCSSSRPRHAVLSAQDSLSEYRDLPEFRGVKQRVVEFPAKFSWEGFPANSKICWEGRESTNSKLQVKCNLPRARTATFPDCEHDLATPRGRGRIAREKAERCLPWTCSIATLGLKGAFRGLGLGGFHPVRGTNRFVPEPNPSGHSGGAGTWLGIIPRNWRTSPWSVVT